MKRLLPLKNLTNRQIFQKGLNLKSIQFIFLTNSTKMGKGDQQQKKSLKRPKEDDDSYELQGHDEQDQEIEDDGEQSSEHSSIDLQEYLKNRDNIPSEPSDLEDDEEEDQEDDQQEEEEEEEEKPKASKKQKLEDKKKQKQSAQSRNRNQQEEDQDDE